MTHRLKAKTILSLAALMATLPILGFASSTIANPSAESRYTFQGELVEGEVKTHTFNVDADVLKVNVTMTMPSGADFDCWVTDDRSRRTGGFSTELTSIPNSKYSGWYASPEWIIVEPPVTTGTWSVSVEAYSGRGNYTITVELLTEAVVTTTLQTIPQNLNYVYAFEYNSTVGSETKVSMYNPLANTAHVYWYIGNYNSSVAPTVGEKTLQGYHATSLDVILLSVKPNWGWVTVTSDKPLMVLVKYYRNGVLLSMSYIGNLK